MFYVVILTQIACGDLMRNGRRGSSIQLCLPNASISRGNRPSTTSAQQQLAAHDQRTVRSGETEF